VVEIYGEGYSPDGGYLYWLLFGDAVSKGYEPTGKETSAFIYFSEESSEAQELLDVEIAGWLVKQAEA